MAARCARGTIALWSARTERTVPLDKALKLLYRRGLN
ncbi:hypothetical protein GGR34_003002 [Microvirga flocculans]|uniref:Uncharacterized protein n=1 Tax=Microvirga flocculans TaxID=217168 RepID=A0A7W6IH01_9HYPH|nr:hypothetical protein [Microvirga flocculans]